MSYEFSKHYTRTNLGIYLVYDTFGIRHMNHGKNWWPDNTDINRKKSAFKHVLLQQFYHVAFFIIECIALPPFQNEFRLWFLQTN
jgi:hypothetical protein